MAYGLQDEGFILKRAPEIKAELDNRAVQLFQDLVPEGDVVDTSESALLGRLIGLVLPSLTELWEVGQGDWSALDPNSATGVSLDNIVQYGGIARFGASASTAVGLFIGENGILIPGGSVVKATNNSQWTVGASVAISPTQAGGIRLVISNVSNNTNYSVSYSNGISSNTVTYTSSMSATETEILLGLQGALNALPTTPFFTSVDGTVLGILSYDIFQTFTWTVTSNILITVAMKVGQLTCTELGPVSAEAQTITQIVTPILGWESVVNPLAASEGRLQETDEELRIRFRNTKLERSSNILDSLYSALLNLDGVEEVRIYENDTDITDSNGVLPHSFLPVVLGGSSQLIAETIWKNKPMGILSQGNTVIQITDSQGFVHNIGLERPNPVTIYVIVNLSEDTEANTPFPGDGVQQVQDSIINYAASNFGVGKDVIYSRLFTPINQIPGHQIDSLFIGTSPSPVGTSNVSINFNSIASFESINISVIIV